MLREDCVERRVDLPPLVEQLREHFGAVFREAVEALGALFLLAPLALEETLRLESAQQRVERPFVDLEALFRKGFAQRIAVLLGAQRGEDGEHQRPASQLEPQVFKDRRVHGAADTMWNMVSDIQCMTHSISCQVAVRGMIVSRGAFSSSRASAVGVRAGLSVRRCPRIDGSARDLA